ncbi:MAG TPA: hypothetical protein P5121_07610 [Caldilineaceae bacterium]|nr:hypothetical protein [Caldilineaceae bacterium]
MPNRNTRTPKRSCRRFPTPTPIILSGDVPSPANPPHGCKFHPRCRYAKALCSQEEPALREIRPGHRAARHFSEKLTLIGVG